MSEVVGTTPAQLAAAVAAIIAAIPSTTDYSRSGGCPERDGTCGCSNRQEEGKEAWQQEEQCSGREWRWRRSRSEEDKGMQFRWRGGVNIISTHTWLRVKVARRKRVVRHRRSSVIGRRRQPDDESILSGRRITSLCCKESRRRSEGLPRIT